MILAPPLGKLLRLRIRGGWRKQLARLRTPRGILLALLGIALTGFWLASALVSARVRQPLSPRDLELRIGAVGFSFCLITIAGALRFRGLFLPREEIERLFSAPVSRADLVRYRLCASGVRGLLGGSVVALLGAVRMPQPAFAALGALVAMLTLTLANHFAAIAFGALELSISQRVKGLARLLTGLGVAGLAVLFGWLFTGGSMQNLPVVGDLLGSLEGAKEALSWVTLPFRPWTRPIVTTSFAEFLPWFLFDLVALYALFEGTARLPVDFRELSLETSASVAARIRRRRFGGAAAGEASIEGVRRVPWFFGRGPLGAIAWRKTGSILRRASSTITMALVVLTLVVLFSRLLAENEAGTAFAPVLVGVLGTFYLASGLRFDFREELERMEAIKAWPLSAERIFLSMLLPEVVLITLLLAAAVGLEAFVQGELHPVTLGCLALLFPVVFGWVALDNAVFLFAPVRMIPGQEGILQNVGRTAMLMVLRLALLALAAGVGWVAFLVTGFAVEALDGAPSTAATLGVVAVWTILVLEDALLVWLGGICLRRFDVATDRG